jgi:argininosuccinate lyase
MELLGFDGLLENSHDGVATVDYYMELSAALVIHMTNLSRLAEDLQIWSSDEFKLVDLDEAYAGTSSIMPQKKNPLILEQVKSYTAESLGAMVSVFTSMKGTSYTNLTDRTMLEPVIIDTAVGSTNVMSGVIETLIPLIENMRKWLRDGFSTMTDLADTLVRTHNLSFRQAHDVVVHVTVKALNENKKAEEITPEMITEAAEYVLGRPLTITLKQLNQSIDPVLNVRRRNVVGGPSPESVQKMIQNQRKQIKEEEKHQNERTNRVNQALVRLSKAENAVKM